MANTNKTKTTVITQTGVMLALLIILQAVTKPAGTIVTGSCVNAVLAMTALCVGLAGGISAAYTDDSHRQYGICYGYMAAL